MLKTATTMIVLALSTLSTHTLLAQGYGYGGYGGYGSYGYGYGNAADPYSMLLANTDLTAMFNTQIEQQIAQYQSAENQIYKDAANHPQVQQAYRQYRANGGQASLMQYATGWAQTAGYTQHGIQRWNSTMADIHTKDRANIAAYNQHVNNLWKETSDQRINSANRNSNMVGDLLSGQGPYTDSSGHQWTLPQNLQVGQRVYDRAGNAFKTDSFGNFYRQAPHSDQWEQMQYAR